MLYLALASWMLLVLNRHAGILSCGLSGLSELGLTIALLRLDPPTLRWSTALMLSGEERFQVSVHSYHEG
jgi:hypothetical protein